MPLEYVENPRCSPNGVHLIQISEEINYEYEYAINEGYAKSKMVSCTALFLSTATAKQKMRSWHLTPFQKKKALIKFEHPPNGFDNDSNSSRFPFSLPGSYERDFHKRAMKVKNYNIVHLKRKCVVMSKKIVLKQQTNSKVCHPIHGAKLFLRFVAFTSSHAYF